MKSRHSITLLLFFILKLSVAQDYHFSQFDANPYYINPALTGERLSDYKGIQINADYRSQMAQYSKTPGAYRSVAAGLDEPLGSKFSMGQFFYNDKSSTGAFNTFGFILSGAYKLIDQTADKAGQHNLSVGVQLGFMNKSLYSDNLTYDAQYSVNSLDGFDRSLPNGETFARQNYNVFNVNFGIYYRATSKNKKLSVFGGLAIYNITQPNQSFYGDGTYSGLPLRINLHGGAQIVVSQQVTMMPQVLYMNQAKASELNLGMLFFYKIQGSFYQPIYGLSVRNKDAIIFQLGLKCKGITFRTSYDVITSSLKAYRNKGLEFSLVTTLNKRNKSSKTPPAADPTASPAP